MLTAMQLSLLSIVALQLVAQVVKESVRKPKVKTALEILDPLEIL